MQKLKIIKDHPDEVYKEKPAERQEIKVRLSVLEIIGTGESFRETERHAVGEENEIKGNCGHDVRLLCSAANRLQMAGREVKDGN